MTKLFEKEAVFNRVMILTSKAGVIKFIYARRRDDLGRDQDTHWQLLDGRNKAIHVSPYRKDLDFFLQENGFEVIQAE